MCVCLTKRKITGPCHSKVSMMRWNQRRQSKKQFSFQPTITTVRIIFQSDSTARLLSHCDPHKLFTEKTNSASQKMILSSTHLSCCNFHDFVAAIIINIVSVLWLWLCSVIYDYSATGHRSAKKVGVWQRHTSGFLQLSFTMYCIHQNNYYTTGKCRVLW